MSYINLDTSLYPYQIKAGNALVRLESRASKTTFPSPNWEREYA
ncbi:MAG: hypothetical protein RIB93_26600 [Coleofasciculus sp. D1-CHI-01]